MMYRSECLNCKRTQYSFIEAQIERTAEEHMMATGHIVEITRCILVIKL